jgi:hypothetical protein
MKARQHNITRISIASALTVALVGVAWASGDWSGAKSKVGDVKRHAEEVKQLLPQETRKIVKEICEADDESRKSAASNASSNARSNVRDKVSELERETTRTIEALDKVIDDDKLKDNHSDARSMKSEVKSRWEKIKEHSQSLLDGRHPVVEYMLSKGQSAHRDRMDSCDAKDISLDAGHAECLMARGETCTVIALTPDSSRAISKGKDQARRYKSQLESELKKSSSDVIKRLIDRRSDFGKCKKFEARVDCYKLCPEIDDDNRLRDRSASWRQDC